VTAHYAVADAITDNVTIIVIIIIIIIINAWIHLMLITQQMSVSVT